MLWVNRVWRPSSCTGDHRASRAGTKSNESASIPVPSLSTAICADVLQCRACRRNLIQLFRGKRGYDFFETRIAAQRIPIGALFELAVSDATRELGRGRELI